MWLNDPVSLQKVPRAWTYFHQYPPMLPSPLGRVIQERRKICGDRCEYRGCRLQARYAHHNQPDHMDDETTWEVVLLCSMHHHDVHRPNRIKEYERAGQKRLPLVFAPDPVDLAELMEVDAPSIVADEITPQDYYDYLAGEDPTEAEWARILEDYAKRLAD